MLKAAKILLAALILAAVGSCHLFDNNYVPNSVALYFNETNVSCFTGGLGSLSLRADPPDGLGNLNVEYVISNEDVAMIYRADRRGVVFTGREEGSTVITAKAANAQASAVINVFSY